MLINSLPFDITLHIHKAIQRKIHTSTKSAAAQQTLFEKLFSSSSPPVEYLPHHPLCTMHRHLVISEANFVEEDR